MAGKKPKKTVKNQKKRVKIHTMDLILIILAVLTIIFVIDMRNIFLKVGAIPDVLVTCFFAAVFGECGAMAWIKTSKEKSAERLHQFIQQLLDRFREKPQQDNEPKE